MYQHWSSLKEDMIISKTGKRNEIDGTIKQLILQVAAPNGHIDSEGKTS